MANGNFAGGNGTANNPYLIEDAFDLDAMRNNLSAHYELIRNINLDISPFNEGTGWNPIGENSSRFTGTFNGNGYIIKTLFINRPSTNYQGLFGHIQGAEIKNVGLENIDVTGGNYSSGLIGRAILSSVIKNTFAIGKVTGAVNNYTGGLVGLMRDSSTIINSYSRGKVTGVGRTGGLVGDARNSTIKNSYSTGKVTGNNYTGGLVGYATSTTTITRSFWDKDTSGQNSSAGGGTGLTTAEMQNPQTFINAGWDQELNDEGNLSWIFEDNQYPRLWFEVPPAKSFIFNQNEYKKYEDGIWKTISQSTPTSKQFEEEGMEDLSILNRRVQEVIDSPFDMELEKEFEEGNIFSKEIDLNKYFDLRSLKINT